MSYVNNPEKKEKINITELKKVYTELVIKNHLIVKANLFNTYKYVENFHFLDIEFDNQMKELLFGKKYATFFSKE